MSATTAAAAELIDGVTIHSLMVQKSSPTRTVVVDEVSMLGAVRFGDLKTWASAQRTASRPNGVQLILSGDALQLPPVEDRFFFQSTEFNVFAQASVLVKLTVIRRQKDAVQLKFLNNVREGIIGWSTISALMKNETVNEDTADLYLASDNATVNQFNRVKL